MPQLSISPNQHVPIEIIRAKEDYLLVYKPAGVPTQPGLKHLNDTLLNGLFSQFGPALQNLGKKRDFGLLHRLDITTSGLVLVGRTTEGYDQLRAQFERREIEKTYLAIVHGNLRHPGRVEHPIRVVRIKGDKTVQLGAHPKAKTAITIYHPLESSRDLTIVRCKILTGRLHQIRVHLASLGHPVVGDYRYGRRSAFDKLLPRNRVALHACSLGFRPPNSKRMTHFDNPLPDDLCLFLQKSGLSGRV